MYTKEAFLEECRTVFHKTEGNTVTLPGAEDLVLFDAPLVGFASADDDLFEKYKQPEIIGEYYFAPVEWLPSAHTVISFFLPFTEAVRSGNRVDRTDPSLGWLYGRIEGQAFIARFMTNVQKLLRENNIEACAPSQDERFAFRFEATSTDGISDFHAESRWSERHAAYACGLGTFGLSRGLISPKGIAGRYASVIISAKWQPTAREYTGVYEYCIRCGACARNCPAQAISLEYGKNNILCNAHIEIMRGKYSPRYGCGKCQVGVPCESTAPGMKAKNY